MEQRPRQEQQKRKRYWNSRYGEAVEEESIERYESNYLKDVGYAGEFTDDEWKELLRTSPKDHDGDPVINSTPITERKEKAGES